MHHISKGILQNWKMVGNVITTQSSVFKSYLLLKVNCRINRDKILNVQANLKVLMFKQPLM